MRGKAPTKLLFNSSQYAITITAAAEDATLWGNADGIDSVGDTWLSSLEGLLGQLPGLAISTLTGVAGQITVHYATASVTLATRSFTSLQKAVARASTGPTRCWTPSSPPVTRSGRRCSLATVTSLRTRKTR